MMFKKKKRGGNGLREKRRENLALRLSLLPREEKTRVLRSAQGTVISKEQREAKRIETRRKE